MLKIAFYSDSAFALKVKKVANGQSSSKIFPALVFGKFVNGEFFKL